MATSIFTSLPTELLDKIIIYSLPEGFEGLALTCRKLYNLCTPSIERHNQLRTRFEDFTYNKYQNTGLLSVHNPSAVNLIQEIAHNPVVARYIRQADFTYDTWPSKARPIQRLPDPDLSESVVALFSESTYLREASLDWREYYALIQEDLERPGWYSQHAAVFLLTLLPNATSLKLPCLWQPCEAAEKLLHAIVHKAFYKPSPSSFLWDSPSLAQVTGFEPYSESGPSGHKFDLTDAVPFLALPKLRSFCARSCVVRDGASIATASEDAELPSGETLETAHFVQSCLDDVAITNFLRRTPNLKELAYTHCTKGQTVQDWDACRFVSVIEREAGSYLESLKIVIGEFRGSLAPGRLSMRGFQCLRKLHLPLEIAACNLANEDAYARDEELMTNEDLGALQQLTDILVPASVSDLSLHSRDPDRDEKALRVMFFDFAARRDDWVPALEQIRLSPRPKEHGAYKEICCRLDIEMMEAGVTLHLGEDLGEEGGEEWDEEELLE